MNSIPLFSIAVSSDLPREQRESLLLVLRTTVDVQESTSRAFGPEWITFVAIIKDIGVLAGTATALVKLASEINTWRKNSRQRGVEPDVKLQYPNRSPLDLTTATDKEVQEWLLQKK